MMGPFRTLCLILLTALGCSDAAPPPAADTSGEAEPALRIVTVAPALSQMVVDLGLGDSIVGVAEYETAAPPGLPVVGNYNEVNTELLLATDPTHVLMMVGPGGPPGRVADLAEQGLFELHTFPFVLSVQDIGAVLYDEHGPNLGTALSVPDPAAALKLRMLKRLAGIGALTRDFETPTVLLVIGTGPVMVCGPGTVHDELLGFAGALNAAADAAVTAPEYGRESLLALSPDVVLFLQPDAPGLTEDDPRLTSFQGLPIPAIEQGRVYVINHPLTLLPSTSITTIGAEMAKAIHPQAADRIDALMAEGDTHE